MYKSASNRVLLAVTLIIGSLIQSSSQHKANVSVESYSFIVEIFLYNKWSGDHDFHCVGTIVRPRFVLTTASCGVQPLPFLLIRLGTSDPENNGTDMHVEKVHPHPKFREIQTDSQRTIFMYNVVVLELCGIIDEQLGSEVELIPKSDVMPLSGSLVAWGGKKLSAKGSNWTLQSYDAHVWPHEDCTSHFKEMPHEDEYCAMITKPDEDDCGLYYWTGLKGGPMLDNDSRQFGIFFGYPWYDKKKCDSTPVIFISVPFHEEWIFSVIDSDPDEPQFEHKKIPLTSTTAKETANNLTCPPSEAPVCDRDYFYWFILCCVIIALLVVTILVDKCGLPLRKILFSSND